MSAAIWLSGVLLGFLIGWRTFRRGRPTEVQPVPIENDDGSGDFR